MSTHKPKAKPRKNVIAARVKSLKARALVLAGEKRLNEASPLLVELAALDEADLLSTTVTVMRDVLETAEILVSSDDVDRLAEVFRKGFRVMRAHKDSSVGDVFAPLNNLATYYDMKGASQARDEANSAILSLAEHLQAPLDKKAAAIFINLGLLFERAGHPGAAAILYRHLHAYMMSFPDLPLESRVNWSAKYGQVLMAIGDYDQAFELFSGVLSVAEGLPNADPLLRIDLMNSAAGAARGKCDFVTAEKLLENATRIAEQSDYSDSHIAGVVYDNLACLYFQLRKRLDDAETLTRRSLGVIIKTGGRATGVFAAMLGSLATIVEAKGETERAEALYRDSISAFESGPDADSRQFARLLTEAGFLYLKLQRPGEATKTFRQACHLRESIPGEQALNLADAISNLATAHFEAGDFSAATPLYQRAIRLRHANQK